MELDLCMVGKDRQCWEPDVDKEAHAAYNRLETSQFSRDVGLAQERM